jgi:4-hydroxy-2-oxoglutarate aldolase
MLLEGIFPAITTPFYGDGRLYLRKLEQNVSQYSRTPVAGLVVLGSTGEAVMLGDDETREVLRLAAQTAVPEKVLLAGVARESVAETLRLADFAASERYDAVLVRTPNYYGPQMRRTEMLNYFRMVADRSALPVILYNIPKFTGYDLAPDVVAELADHANIIGLKDSTGNVERLAQIVALTAKSRRRTVTVTATFAAVTDRMMAPATQESAAGSFVLASELGGRGPALATAPPRAAIRTRTKEVGFQVLNGSAERLLAGLEAGAGGAVLAMGACCPQACQEVYTAWKENDPVNATEKQARLAKASAGVASAMGIPGIKYACDLNGYYGGRPRVPLLALTGEERTEVERLMADVRN